MGNLYKRGATWWGYWTTPQGERVRRTLGTHDRSVAAATLRRLELADVDPQGHSQVTLGQAFDRMFLDMDPSTPEATLSHDRQKAANLERLLGRDSFVARFTEDTIREYIRTRTLPMDREGEGVTSSTVCKELGVLRKALRAVKVSTACVPKIKARYVPRDRWLTRAQADALLTALPADRALWVAIGLLAGLRSGEIERLRWEHVDLAGWDIHVPGTKTTASRRHVPIAEELHELLTDAHERATSREVVPEWPNVRRDLTIALSIGLERKTRRRLKAGEVHPDRIHITPNDLRRTFGSWLVQAGVPVLDVAKLMGHSSTRMVERVYGHLARENLTSAIATLADTRTVCATGVHASGAKLGTTGGGGKAKKGQSSSENAQLAVPRGRFERPTRGFSVRTQIAKPAVILQRKRKAS